MEHRFTVFKNFGGLQFIRDGKDGTIVAAIHGYGRPQEYTEAMLQVMLSALNNAVERPQNQNKP